MEYFFLYRQYEFADGDHRKPHKLIGGRHPSRLRAAYHFVRRLSNKPSVGSVKNDSTAGRVYDAVFYYGNRAQKKGQKLSRYPGITTTMKKAQLTRVKVLIKAQPRPGYSRT